MPKRILMFSLLLTAIVALPAVRANADELDIQTSNVQMLLDASGGIFIRTAPVSPVIVNPAVNQKINRNSRTRATRANNVMKCRNVTQRRNSIKGGNRIYTSSTTTICS